jgi:TRAP transporter 4TM/12TM fusion protein
MTNSSKGSDVVQKLSSRTRDLPGPYRAAAIVIAAIGIGIVVFYLFHFSILGYTLIDIGYLYLLITLFIPVVFLIFPAHGSAPRNRVPWYDLILAVLSLLASFYYFYNAEIIILEAWEIVPPPFAKYNALILCILVLEAGRRTGGNAFGAICLFFMLMPVFANYLPSVLHGANFPFWMTMSWHAMGRESIIGLPMRVVANILIGFMIFGVALNSTGGGQFFLNLANSLLGNKRGGPAKVSIIASGLFGSISGSIISNVVTTGSFTIPAMKKTGYPAHYAGAIEACASAGGVLMPPIMGAVAFIMADFLSIPYATVIKAAVIPSILYYSGLFIQVDAYAAKAGLKGLPKEELPSFKNTILMGWFYLIAFGVLLYYLLYERSEPQAPFYGTAVLFFLAMLRSDTRITFKKLMAWLESCARVLAEITSMLCSVGFIIGALIMTGVAASFSYEIIALAGDSLILLLVFGALTSFVLGMGVTISACYVILALILAPALIKAGLYPLAVHLFVLYCGLMSFVTPPVAIGAYAGAGLAGADPMKTAFKAMQFGFVKYIIPFFFVLNPALIMHGPVGDILWCFGTAVVGVFMIGAALEGYLAGIGQLSRPLRVLILSGGILIGIPETRTDIAGFIVVVGSLILFQGAVLAGKILSRTGGQFKAKQKGD